MSIFDAPDIKWCAPTELYGLVTIASRPGVTPEKVPDDIGRLRRERATAYHEYMEAATAGAESTIVNALKEHWERFETAIQVVITRAQKVIIQGALEKRLIGFGYHGTTALVPQIIRPQLWSFLVLDFELAIARAEGIIIHGIKLAVLSDNPRRFSLAIRHLLEPAAAAVPPAHQTEASLAPRPKRGRPPAHDWGDGFTQAVRRQREANPEANISSTAKALLEMRYWPPPEPDLDTVRRQVSTVWDAPLKQVGLK